MHAFERDKNIEQPDAGCRSPGHENRAASSRPLARGLEEFRALVHGSIFMCALAGVSRQLCSLPNGFFHVIVRYFSIQNKIPIFISHKFSKFSYRIIIKQIFFFLLFNKLFRRHIIMCQTLIMS